MYKAACTNVQIVDICWFYQRCIHSPAGEQTAPAPRRYFLGEAGNEAPCRTQLTLRDPFILSTEWSYEALETLIRLPPCEDCPLRPCSSALLSIRGATPHPSSNLLFCLG